MYSVYIFSCSQIFYRVQYFHTVLHLWQLWSIVQRRRVKVWSLFMCCIKSITQAAFAWRWWSRDLKMTDKGIKKNQSGCLLLFTETLLRECIDRTLGEHKAWTFLELKQGFIVKPCPESLSLESGRPVTCSYQWPCWHLHFLPCSKYFSWLFKNQTTDSSFNWGSWALILLGFFQS